MKLTKEQQKLWNVYHYAFPSIDQFLDFYNHAFNDSKQNVKISFQQLMQQYLKKHMNVDLMMNYLNQLNINYNSSSQEIRIKLRPFYQLLDQLDYCLAMDDAAVLIEYPLFQTLFSKLFGQNKIIAEDQFQKLANDSIYFEILCRVYLDCHDIEVDESLNNKDDRTLSKTKILTHEEEIELAKRIEAGDIKAQETFILANQQLVKYVAKSYIGNGLEFDDLFQEGIIGLMTAIQKFDYQKGYKFSTYAVWWIRHAIYHAIRKARAIPVPTYREQEYNHIMKVHAQLVNELQRKPSLDEWANHLGMEKESLQEIVNSIPNVVSFESKVSSEDDKELGDFYEDSKARFEEDVVQRQYVSEILKLSKEILSEKEYQVLLLRFGLADGTSYTLEEVGRKFNVTRERIRQIEAKALIKLKHSLKYEKNKTLHLAENEPNLEEVGKKFNVTRERTRQIENAMNEPSLEEVGNKFNVTSERTCQIENTMNEPNLEEAEKKINVTRERTCQIENVMNEPNLEEAGKKINVTRERTCQIENTMNEPSLEAKKKYTKFDIHLLHSSLSISLLVDFIKLFPKHDQKLYCCLRGIQLSQKDIVPIEDDSFNDKQKKYITIIENDLKAMACEYFYYIKKRKCDKEVALKHLAKVMVIKFLRFRYPNSTLSMIMDAVKKLPLEQRQAIYRVHGEDLCSYLLGVGVRQKKSSLLNLAYKDIAAILNEHEVVHIKTRSNTLFLLMEKYPEISLEQWILNIQSLPKKQREIMQYVHGESLDQNRSFSSQDKVRQYANYQNGLRSLEQLANGTRRVITLKEQKKNMLFLLMEKYPEISLEQWILNIQSLPKKQREIMQYVHGESLDQNRSFSSQDKVRQYANYQNGLRSLEQLANGTRKVITPKEKLFKILKVDNVQILNEALEQLELFERDVFYSVHGQTFEEYHEISNFQEYERVFEKLSGIMLEIQKGKKDTLLSLLMKKYPDITKKHWHVFINALSPKQKEVIYEVNGVDLDESNWISRNLPSKIYERYYYAIQNLEALAQKAFNKTEERDKNIIDVYGTERVRFIFQFLNKEELSVFLYRHGADLNECNEFPEHLNHLRNMYICTIEKMKNLLEIYTDLLQEFLDCVGLASFEEAQHFISLLSIEEQAIIYQRRGEKLNTLNSFIYGKSFAYYKRQYDDAVQHLKKLKKEDNQRKEYNQRKEEIINREILESQKKILLDAKLSQYQQSLYCEFFQLYGTLINEYDLMRVINKSLLSYTSSEGLSVEVSSHFKVETAVLEMLVCQYQMVQSQELFEAINSILSVNLAEKYSFVKKNIMSPVIYAVFQKYVDQQLIFEGLEKPVIKAYQMN